MLASSHGTARIRLGRLGRVLVAIWVSFSEDVLFFLATSFLPDNVNFILIATSKYYKLHSFKV